MTPPTSDQPRPVWLTQDERDAVNRARYTTRMTRSSWDAQTLRGIVAAWDAAPAEPTEAAQWAVATAARMLFTRGQTHITREHCILIVLRALGMPDA